MTNPTQEAIPVEELKRMKQDASSACNTIDWPNFFPEDLYLEAAKAEYLRARQQAQGETVTFTKEQVISLMAETAYHVRTHGYGFCSVSKHLASVLYERWVSPEGKINFKPTENAQAQYTSDSPEAEDGGDSLEEGLQLARDAGMSQSDWDKQTKKSLTEDIPVPEEMEKYIISRLNQYTWSGKTYKNAYSSMVAMYRHLIEAAQKQPETMGKELRFSCNWSNRACDEFIVCMEDEEEKSYYTVLKGVFARLVFNKDLIDDRRRVRQEAADYRKVLEKIRTNIAEGLVYTRPMKSREMHQIAAEILDKYPSPPTK